MTLKVPPRDEVEDTIKYIENLRRSPKKYDRWLDTVLDKALKGWRAKGSWKAAPRKSKRS